MPEVAASEAFDELRRSLPSGAYEVRADYESSEKIELRRSYGTPKVVLVWRANGLKNELTTRTDYVAALKQWFNDFKAETSKPQYSRTFSFTAQHLNEVVAKHGNEMAAAILAVDLGR